MSLLTPIANWLKSMAEPSGVRWSHRAPSWLASTVVHLLILLVVLLIGVWAPLKQIELMIVSASAVPDDSMAMSDVFGFADVPQETIGASPLGAAETFVVDAPILGMSPSLPSMVDVSEIPTPTVSSQAAERMRMGEEVRVATGARFAENLAIKGIAGLGATGTGGAIDRITQEILLSLEQRKTLVVWLFDQSGSLARQRAEIIQRFDRIYDELGVIEASENPAFARHEDKPLLSAVVGFGEKVSFLTSKPTDDVGEIKSAVQGIKTDDSGVERTFAAVNQAAERYKRYRTQDPRRNVMFVIFTDEVGDDETDLDRDVALCRRYEIPVFCVGVPAPFGRRNVMFKYVDPDPKYDQSAQWVPVRQGPESFMPELVNFGAEESIEPMDSGFGPYSLTRLCYETGGIFFAVHPNRDSNRGGRRDTAVLSAQLNYFFDPDVMRAYRPDYASIKEYQKLLTENKARAALVEAAELAWVTPMERPQLMFPKTSDAELANRLTQAQRAAAIVEPKINEVYEVLKRGERDREKLNSPRWQAGYDLSMGRTLAAKVRAEGYNTLLAKAKQGMRFEDPKNDTWRLQPSNQVDVTSALEKQAEQAKMYLERVVREHPKTPWAVLAERELRDPLGWRWVEMNTGVNAPRQVAANNNNNNRRPPQDDKARNLPRPEKRPPPKL